MFGSRSFMPSLKYLFNLLLSHKSILDHKIVEIAHDLFQISTSSQTLGNILKGRDETL